MPMFRVRLTPRDAKPGDADLLIWIDPGRASAQEIADVLVALSELHRAAGGAGLVVSDDASN